MDVWKDIPGWGGLYRVSDQGQVARIDSHLPNGRFIPGHILTTFTQNGNLRVNLTSSTKKQGKQVNQLVAQAFLPKAERHNLRHIDGDKANCAATNLEWITPPTAEDLRAEREAQLPSLRSQLDAQTKPGEVWKPTSTHPYLEASSLGRLRELPHIAPTGHLRKGRIVVPHKNRKGYYYQAYNDSVHVHVANAFHGPRPHGLETRHLNGDPTDNRPDNLAYGTRSETQRDTIRHGRNPQLNRTHCPAKHEYTPENTITKKRPNGKTHRLCRECKREEDRARYLRRKAKNVLD